MKSGAFICLFIFSLLTVEPLYSYYQAEEDMCCMEECSKESSEEGEEDCENTGCNPFMSCIYGNFFLVEKPYLSVTWFIVPGKKIATVNDNRIVGNLSDCWHPPEAAVSKYQ